MNSREETSGDSVRLDKWLWAARFFKTRQLAVESIEGGKVQVNGQRTKPGRPVQPGMCLRIHKGSLEWEIEVLGLSRQRRPASEAALLYSESEASRTRREVLLRQQRDLGLAADASGERPTKRDRRQIQRFVGKSE
jgi:ribosome-associated heat shock protein Hsp15